jgi:protein gp37
MEKLTSGISTYPTFSQKTTNNRYLRLTRNKHKSKFPGTDGPGIFFEGNSMSHKIIWTDKTLNFSTGCTPCSDGCKLCFAKRMAKRLQKIPATAHKYRNGFQYTEHTEEIFATKLRKKPLRIFLNSMSDTFHEDATEGHLRTTFDFIKSHPRHTFQILTKRPQNIPEWIEWTDNVQLGVTVCNQSEISKIEELVATSAKFKFLSIEPMLSDISLRWLPVWRRHDGSITAVKSDSIKHFGAKSTCHLDGLRELDLIIVGGESGSGARPMHPDWVRSVRDQCKEAGVAFLFKQYGNAKNLTVANRIQLIEAGFNDNIKKGGRTLDGKIHDGEVPV